MNTSLSSEGIISISKSESFSSLKHAQFDFINRIICTTYLPSLRLNGPLPGILNPIITYINMIKKKKKNQENAAFDISIFLTASVNGNLVCKSHHLVVYV